ncbi:MAG TPA: hypothetical protein VNK95_23840, partial [Caldilineaceae bacterium]|nr:hypothetical protein [Caldilineaceae bacterium]
MFHHMLRNGRPYAGRLVAHRAGDLMALVAHPAQRRRRPASAVLLLLCVLLVSACAPVQPVAPSTPAGAYDAAVPSAWFALSLKLVKETPGFSPPVASRAFGYMGVTLYETVQPGMPGYRSLAGQLNGLGHLPPFIPDGEVSWPLAANAALATMTRRLFVAATPENQAAIEELAARLEAQENLDPATVARSAAWGERVAEAIYAWSLTDGGHDGYATSFAADYLPPVGPGLWVSTPPGYLQPLQPYWGQNRPFALSAVDECPAAPPPAYSEEVASDFYAEAFEVYDTVRNLSAEQEAIARFWADDPVRTATPPGHWVSILSQVLAQEEATLDLAAEAYAKLGIALADAFITCWHTKYVYNVLR